MKKILVSAIISTYNSEKFIEGKIQDLLNQTIVDKLEIIIVNSGSEQNEDSIIREYLKKYSNIKYIKTGERETIYKAWNRGIKIAEGEFITNANTDDRLKNDAFEIMSDELIKNPNTALVYADQCISKCPNQLFAEMKDEDIVKMPEFDRLLQLSRCIVLSQPMWRSSLHFEDNIWFDERYEICGDHEFELHISEFYEMRHINKTLGVFYKSPKKNNKSFQNMTLMKKERDEITFYYTRRYTDTLTNEKLLELNKQFIKYIQIPILFYFLYYFIFRIIRPSSTKYSPEFIYMLVVLINIKLGKIVNARNYCNKFLRIRKSFRIEKCYTTINV